MSQKLFINKKNIGYVNFLVTNALGLEDLTKDDKRFVIKELVSNMNYVYKKLNKRKISKKNFDEAFNRFNKLVFDRTVKSLQRNLEENEEMVQTILSENPEYISEKQISITPFTAQTDGAFAAIIKAKSE